MAGQDLVKLLCRQAAQNPNKPRQDGSVGFKKHGSGAMTCSQLAPNATPSKPFELRGLATDPEEWARLPRGKNFHFDAPVGGAMAAKGERGLLRPT